MQSALGFSGSQDITLANRHKRAASHEGSIRNPFSLADLDGKLAILNRRPDLVDHLLLVAAKQGQVFELRTIEDANYA